MLEILTDLNNFFFKSNINDLITDLKQKNFTNTTVLKYLQDNLSKELKFLDWKIIFLKKYE